MTVRELLRLEFRPMAFTLKICRYSGDKTIFKDTFDSEDDKDYEKLDKLDLLDKKVAMISFSFEYLKITLALGEI